MPLPAAPLDTFPEPFAVEWGQDRFGLFMAFGMTFGVERVVQRMRWIPAGSFWMGSPETEAGRFDDEVLHRVELSRGYWLADTPVTQALWEAVMGGNPSGFKALDKPVENVGWDDCQTFVARLNARVQGLDARLPTEAEWEYACRAGTTTATWVGNLDIRDNEAVQLDAIAWYRANAEGSTHAVAQKAANPWGLYDMLGNVFEWCADRFGAYDGRVHTDPQGVTDGSFRVLRGGAWVSFARFVRAGFRNSNDPALRLDGIGLRLARYAAPTARP